MNPGPDFVPGGRRSSRQPGKSSLGPPPGPVRRRPWPPSHRQEPPITPVSSRRHDIDALRALAFGLLILYHVGMYYVAAWPWHLKSPHAAAWLQAPMQVVNIWRMDLVFLVSGVALGFLFRGREPLVLIRQRALRLLLPLAFGMTVVVPYQAYAEALARGLVAPGFDDFMLRYLRMGPWPKGAFAGSDFGMTWNHLWYLPYLFVYTAAVALLQPLLDSAAGQRLRAAFTGLRRWRLLAAARPAAAALRTDARAELPGHARPDP